MDEKYADFIDTFLVDNHPQLAEIRRQMIAIYDEDPSTWNWRGWKAVLDECARRTNIKTSNAA